MTIVLRYYRQQTDSLHPHRRRQSSNLLMEKFLRLSPDPSIGPVLQLQETGDEGFAEHLGALPGEERGKVINADHAQRRALRPRRQGYGHSGLVEGRGDAIYRDRVMWVCPERKG